MFIGSRRQQGEHPQQISSRSLAADCFSGLVRVRHCIPQDYQTMAECLSWVKRGVSTKFSDVRSPSESNP
jgi:hypothetical protein